MCSSSAMWYHNYMVHIILRALQITPEFEVFWNNLRWNLQSLWRSLMRQLGLNTTNSAVLNEDVVLQILDLLDDHDKIVLAYSCQWFRRILQDNPRLLRKVNLSKCIAKRQQSIIRKLLRDEQMFQHITELNLNNQRIRKEMRLDVETFIISICHQLEALHVMNCGLCFITLHHILQIAPKLIAFSFSITDLSRDEACFMMVFNNFHLENIRKLNIEGLFAVTHIHILKYLVLSCCKFLEELEVCVWDIPRRSEYIIHSVLGNAEFLHQQSAESLQHFHSLTVRTVNICSGMLDTHYELAESELHKFIVSVVKKKSRKMKWKKLWISPLSDSLFDRNEDLFSLTSVEAFAVNNEFQEDKLKSLFPKMNDRVVRKLQLHCINQVHQFHRSIARIGGDTLQSLTLSVVCEYCESDVPLRPALNSLFSACSNIRELYLWSCHFDRPICLYLSKVRHLVRIQLQQCAIAPDRSNKQVMDEGNVEMLTFVESCPNIKECDLCGCRIDHCHSQHFIANDDLLPIAKWTKLESLTCRYLALNTEQDNQKPVTEERRKNGFLRIVAQNCKFLQTLRFGMDGFEPYLAFLEHTKQLKHLGVIEDIDLGSEDVWKLLGSVTNLERICIQSMKEEPINIAAAVEMIQKLPHLHVLHLHVNDVNNIRDFRKQIMKTLEEEKSDRIFRFEFYIEKGMMKCKQTDKDVLPLNISELCFAKSFMK